MAERQRKHVGLTIAFWVMVVGAAAGAFYYYATRETVYKVTATQVARGMVEKTVSAISSGTVMPGIQSRIAAASLGVISKVHVKEGDRVQEGDLLFELGHEELDAQVTLTEANLRVGESRVEQVKIGAKIADEVSAAQLSQAQAQLDAAKADFERIKSLADRRAVSQSDFDKVSLAYRVAREMLATAEAGRKELEVRQEEVRAAETGLQQLDAALTVARALREKAFVRSPFAGVVAKIMFEVGEAVALGLPLAVLVQEQDRYISAPFDEANIKEMFVGQKARITLDAYPEQVFDGELTYIAPVVTIVKDLSRMLDVKVRIISDPEKFMPGMSADVTLISDKKEDTLYVPTESLVRDEFAYVIENGRAWRREVKLGIGNWERREILEGLREGETLVTSVNIKGLLDGVPLQVVDELDIK